MTDLPTDTATPLPDSEFARIIDVRHLDEAPIHLLATPQECRALAKRFGLVRIKHLQADVRLSRDGAIIVATGRLHAAIVQACAISAEDLSVAIDTALSFRFVPDGGPASIADDEEMEITEDDCDEIPFSGSRFDLGEAVAQSMVLSIDPYATGPEAEQVRQAGLLSDAVEGPFAALAALRKPD